MWLPAGSKIPGNSSLLRGAVTKQKTPVSDSLLNLSEVNKVAGLIEKEIPTLVFFCEFGKTFKNTYHVEQF